MLEREFKYYLKHQNELLKKYNNRYIVIVGDNVIGDYDNALDAFEEASKKYEAGKFLIQECTEGKGAYTQTFHSRVSFA